MTDIPEIDITALDGLLDGECVLIDVREDDEYAEGHIRSAVAVPLATVPERIDELPSDTTVYVVCAMGGRSARAVEFLRGRGLDAVNVAGGTRAWIDSGRDVVRGADPS